jgi:hypothetical protein
MGADLILTYCPTPKHADGTALYFNTHDAETRTSRTTPEGERALAQIRANIDALTAKKALEVAYAVGWDAPEYVLSMEDMKKLEEAEDAGQDIWEDLLVAHVRRALHKAVSEYLGDPKAWFRDVVFMVVGDQPALFTGGMSWGDDPTESYEDICLLSASGVTDFTLED